VALTPASHQTSNFKHPGKEVNACRASKFGGSRRYHPALAERQS
jgi:hypothetical protein